MELRCPIDDERSLLANDPDQRLRHLPADQ